MSDHKHTQYGFVPLLSEDFDGAFSELSNDAQDSADEAFVLSVINDAGRDDEEWVV